MWHGLGKMAVLETKLSPFSPAADMKVLLQEAQGSIGATRRSLVGQASHRNYLPS